MNKQLKELSALFICVHLKIFLNNEKFKNKKFYKNIEEISSLNRKVKYYLRNIQNLKKELSMDNFNSFDEKFINFSNKLSFQINSIKQNIKILEEAKVNLISQLHNQRLVLEKLESCYKNVKFL